LKTYYASFIVFFFWKTLFDLANLCWILNVLCVFRLITKNKATLMKKNLLSLLKN